MPDHDPLDLDAAISADLDGELDAYAAELGLSPAEVRDQVSTPAATERREALAAARARLRSPVAAVDDVTRRRLLDAAAPATAASSRGNRTLVARALAVAAAIALVVGTVVVVGGRGSDDGAKSSGSGGGSAAARGDLGDLGSVDQRKVESLLGPQAGSVAPENAGADNSVTAPGFTPDAKAATPAQVQECADQYASVGDVRFRASGAFSGRPAVILGIDRSDRTIVFVVAAGACTEVLYSASR